MKSSRCRLVPLWAGLLLLGGPALSPASGDPVGDLVVAYENGSVTLNATNVPLDFVLRELAAAANLRLVLHVAIDRHITARYRAQPLPDVVAELLAEDSYQLYAATDPRDDDAIPGVLWIFAEGSTIALAATAYLEIALIEGGLPEKQEAIRELRRLGTPEAAKVLSQALVDEHPSIRRLARDALAEIGGDDALAAIASVTADADPLARGKAAEAIAMAGGNSAAAYLQLALNDADPRVRAAAIDSLVELDSGQAIALIQGVLRDPDPKVRARAADVLDFLEDEAMFDALYVVE